MAKQMPVGTIRHWKNGDVIKAHENSIYESGWIPLSTSPALETIGRNCDLLANSMIHLKLPINGEKFLDHEIREFMRKDGESSGPYIPEDFKKYEGFYNAARYSFRNEFSRRFMADKIALAEEINNALVRADLDKENQRSEINAIKKSIRASFKFFNPFTIGEAKKLEGIVERTHKQLQIGLNLEGTDKQIYDNAVSVANSLPENYERIGIKRQLKENAQLTIDNTFKDNWGIRESVKELLENKYGEYVRKYSKQISDDEAADQEALFGVKLDDEPDVFYTALFKKLANKDKTYPFKELIYLRFETKYGKSMDGDWNIDMLPAIYNIEKLMLTLPSGHFLTNNDLQMITNKDYGGGHNGGYAWYNQDEKRINFTNKAATAFQVWGKLDVPSEFGYVCAHEVGHAVSRKFGRDNNLDYKKFVVACGWSYQQMALKERMHATGDDPDIKREGSNSNIKLLTKYAHKSQEEAFAEYYSIYSINKTVIDKWLETHDSHYLEQKSKLVVSHLQDKELVDVSNYYDKLTGNVDVDNYVSKLNLNIKDHLFMELVNPWHVKYSKSEEEIVNESDNKMLGIRITRHERFKPAIMIKKGIHKYVCINEAKVNEGCKYTKKFCPAIVINDELYSQLKDKFSFNEIKQYILYMAADYKVPVQSSAPVFKKGLEYRSDILEVNHLKQSEAIFRQMKKIFESSELKKALSDIFGLNKLRGLMSDYTQTVVINEETGEFETIVKAKANELIGEIKDFDSELETLKKQIDT